MLSQDTDYFRIKIFPFFKIRESIFGDEFIGSLKNEKVTKMSHHKYMMFIKLYCIGYVI